MAARRPSAAVLEGIWRHFVRWSKGEGANVTKRGVSTTLLRRPVKEDGKDPHIMSRWTNPGERENWRIPLSRVQEAVLILRGKPEDYDALMLARLSEMQAQDPDHAVFHAMQWALDYAERNAPSDERFLLGVYRQTTENYPHRIFDQKENRENVEGLMRDIMKREWDDKLNEPSEEPPDEEAAQKYAEKKAAILSMLGKSRKDYGAMAEEEQARAEKLAELKAEAERKKLLKDRSSRYMTDQLMRKLRGMHPPTKPARASET